MNQRPPMSPPPVSEEELHAYVDGLLDDDGRRRVEAFLAENPAANEMVLDWLTQNDGLRAAFAGYARSTSSDVRLVSTPLHDQRRPRRRLALAAAAVGIFVLGGITGSLGPALLKKPDITLAYTDILPREAKSAFLVYASEVRHPVEVYADEEAHLATWLGKRLAVADLKVPNLQSLGYRLVGGRLLPVAGKPGAMFMYEDAGGKRLTVIVGRDPENDTTSFRFASSGGLETFYWIDGGLGYAVTGEVSRTVLQKVAEECYRQFPS
ncbi:anti-sigma factor [Neorhizobium sp. NCHU2750]|uniref:anti-sigma factor family protein n=1 Tax=Neorhizobium sp. NCHU2750 TaxID=1825976 RepID=UPI000E721F51|nr:membrane protein [Neorhizobium sp. NCHU2750]